MAAWQESGLILQVFPLHETNALTQLKTSWVRKFFAPQPLGKKNYNTNIRAPGYELFINYVTNFTNDTLFGLVIIYSLNR